MTFNVISDIHCGYDKRTNRVMWNRNLPADYEEEYLETQRTKGIDNLVKIQAQLQSLKNLPNVSLKKDYNLKTKAEYKKFYFVDPILTRKQCLERIQKLIDALYKNIPYENIDCDATAVYKYIRAKTNLVLSYYTTVNPIQRMLSDFIPEKLQPADYLLVAGDLGLNTFYHEVYKELKERTKDLFKDIFFIKGNHDYWDTSFSIDKINFDDRYLEKDLGDNVVLLGCTMWSPIPKEKEYVIAHGMNDFNYIPKFTPAKQTEIFKEESKWIREKMSEYSGKKIVLMTHHLPNFDVIADQYKHSNCNESYAVMDGSTSDIKPNVWVHGHSHQFFDTTTDGIRYIRNPIGYREHYGYLPSEVYSSHWYNTIIEV